MGVACGPVIMGWHGRHVWPGDEHDRLAWALHVG